MECFGTPSPRFPALRPAHLLDPGWIIVVGDAAFQNWIILLLDPLDAAGSVLTETLDILSTYDSSQQG